RRSARAPASGGWREGAPSGSIRGRETGAGDVDDGVVGVIGRAAYGRRIEAVLDWTQSERRHVGVLFVGLDGADDEVLCQAAERVSSVVRRGDAVTRLAGDELAVILSDVSEHHEVQAAAARARTV